MDKGVVFRKKIASLVGHQIKQGGMRDAILNANKEGRFTERQIIEALAIIAEIIDEYESAK